MKGRLKTSEINRVLDKIRNHYDEYSEKYGTFLFNRKAFEDRFLNALRMKTDLQAFAFAEVTAFEDLKKKLNQKTEENRIRKELPFTQKIEKMLEDFRKNTEKYPALHTKSSLAGENQRICGAFAEFYDRFWLQLFGLLGQDLTRERKTHDRISMELQKYFLTQKNRLPSRVESFELALKRDGFDQSHLNFMREAAMLAGQIRLYIRGLRDRQADLRVQSEDQPDASVLLPPASDYIEQIISDFRFTKLLK